MLSGLKTTPLTTLVWPLSVSTSLPVAASLIRYDGTNGNFLDVFAAAGSGGLIAPPQIVFGPDNNLYVTTGVVHEIRNAELAMVGILR